MKQDYIMNGHLTKDSGCFLENIKVSCLFSFMTGYRPGKHRAVMSSAYLLLSQQCHVHRYFCLSHHKDFWVQLMRANVYRGHLVT